MSDDGLGAVLNAFQAIVKDGNRLTTEEVNKGFIAIRSEMARNHDKIVEHLEKNYVTRDRFEPVQGVVYGLVAVILLGTVTALVALVVHK